MRGGRKVGVLVLLAALLPAGAPCRAYAQGGQVVDRIVARVESDIITQSDVRELAGYQQLVGEQAEPDAEILNELIEQWVVNNEATAAGFAAPAESEIARETARVAGQFPTPAAYEVRLAALGLTQQDVQRIVTRQIFLARYLDYKFRPAVQVDDDAIAKYYQERIVEPLKSNGQQVPDLSTVSDQIREILIQRGIDDRTASWFEETKSRLTIEIEPVSAAPGSKP